MMKKLFVLGALVMSSLLLHAQDETVESIKQNKSLAKIKLLPFIGIGYEHGLSEAFTLSGTINYWDWVKPFSGEKRSGYSLTSDVRWYPNGRMNEFHIGGYTKYAMMSNNRLEFLIFESRMIEETDYQLSVGVTVGWQFINKRGDVAFDIYGGYGGNIYRKNKIVDPQPDDVADNRLQEDFRAGFTVGYIIK